MIGTANQLYDQTGGTWILYNPQARFYPKHAIKKAAVL